MTRVSEAARTGSGRVLANFWEIPRPSWTIAARTLARLKEAGLGGALLGAADEPLCQIPVSLNRAGLIMLGGLNPVAMAGEAGIEAENVAGSGIMDFQQLKSIWDL
jgi:repressor of nif and glnA expression